MGRFFVASLAAIACALGSITVHATDVEVTVTETDSSGSSQVVAAWTQSQDPIPEMYVIGYYTTVSVWNATGLSGDQYVTWYSSSHFGGFTNYQENFNVLSGVSYDSSESTPNFILGTYTGVNINPDYTYDDISYVIAVLPDHGLDSAPAQSATGAAVAVPEPATWATMVVGLGMVGFAVRRRQKISVVYA